MFANISVIAVTTISPSRCLLSSTEDQLSTPRSRTKTSSFRFSSPAPCVWKGLTATVRAAPQYWFVPKWAQDPSLPPQSWVIQRNWMNELTLSVKCCKYWICYVVILKCCISEHFPSRSLIFLTRGMLFHEHHHYNFQASSSVVRA